MKISIDIDGVLANFTEAFLPVVERVAPGKVPPDFVPSNWYWDPCLTREDVSAAFAELARTPNFWRTLKPLPGLSALYTFLADHRRDIEFYLITARAPSAGDTIAVQTRDWLYHHFGVMATDLSVITVGRPERKYDVITGAEIALSIDDHPGTVRDAPRYRHRAYLLDQPWNRGPEAKDLPRLSTLNDFFAIVEAELEAGK